MGRKGCEKEWEDLKTGMLEGGEEVCGSWKVGCGKRRVVNGGMRVSKIWWKRKRNHTKSGCRNEVEGCGNCIER